MTRSSVTCHRLGRVEYHDGLELQRQFQAARRAGTVGDTLLLLEHPPVLTMGRGASAANIVTPKAQLDALGVEVFETDRGGDVTYHGPGQIVGYPLLHLGPGRQDVRKYVRALEETIIRALGEWGLEATRFPQWPGVWVGQSRLGGPRKICALGVHISRWYTRHGFALNVRPDLSHFGLIVPCGIREAGVTSMEAELGRPVDPAEVEPRLAARFAEVFECDVVSPPAPSQTVSVVLARDDGRVLLLKRTEARGGFWQPVTGRVQAGEAPLEAAARELREETGLALAVQPLGYAHAFAWGEAQPPVIATETAFFARAPAGAAPRVDPAEHDALEWVTRAEAMRRVPFAGLRRALSMPSATGG